MHVCRRILLSTIVFAAVSPANAQDERLTLEWIFSDDGRMETALPRQTWLDAERLVTYDTRVPKDERTLITVDAGNGRTRTLVDADEAIDGLTGLFEPEEPYEELGWPAVFGPNGRWAVYLKSGDLALLNLRNSEVIAVTRTDEEESSPRFSPDGQWLAYVRANDIYAWHIESAEEKRLTLDGTDTTMNGTVSWVYWEELLNRSDRGYAWSPDSSSIAYLQTDESGVGEMHYVDFEPNLPNVVRQRHPKPGHANPKVRAGVVSLDTASTTWIDLGAYLYEYLPRILWLPDSQRVAVQTMHRPQTVLDVFIADASTGAASHLFREMDDGWVNVHDDLYFLNDGEHFVWRSERDGYSHLYLYDMNGEVVRQITQGEYRGFRGGLPGFSTGSAFVRCAGTGSPWRHVPGLRRHLRYPYR